MNYWLDSIEKGRGQEAEGMETPLSILRIIRPLLQVLQCEPVDWLRADTARVKQELSIKVQLDQ